MVPIKRNAVGSIGREKNLLIIEPSLRDSPKSTIRGNLENVSLGQQPMPPARPDEGTGALDIGVGHAGLIETGANTDGNHIARRRQNRLADFDPARICVFLE